MCRSILLLALLACSLAFASGAGGAPAHCKTIQTRAITTGRQLWSFAKQHMGLDEEGPASALRNNGLPAGEQRYCKLRADPNAKLEAELGRIQGQPDAKTRLRLVLRLNDKAYRSVDPKKGRRKVLTVHISGPSGVGKTMAARAMARAVVDSDAGEPEDVYQLCGVLSFIGHMYSSSTLQSDGTCKEEDSPEARQKVEKYKVAIMQQVAAYVKDCPRSVFIFEDVQHMSGALIEKLLPLFDNENRPMAVGADGEEQSTSDAVFVLVSDLGEQALEAGLDRTEAKKRIKEATKLHWPGAKLPKVMNDIIAFLPLTTEQMAGVARRELAKQKKTVAEVHKEELPSDWMGELAWSADVPLRIAELVQGDKKLQERQGRGVSECVEDAVENAFDKVGSELTRTQNLKLVVGKGDGRAIKGEVETIVDADEFVSDREL